MMLLDISIMWMVSCWEGQFTINLTYWQILTVEFLEKKTISRTREQVLIDYMGYIKKQLKQGVPIRAMTRHILGLYHGQNNAKFFRRLLSGKTVELGHLDDWLEFIKK